ncbi:related to Phosphatidylserine decarboxylase proenzyme 2 [Zygosaccharomyces bailii]|nr:related to Phosphatidylserine decarboxylase proenzyme 2 [Zygosaccharomyces bailii]
MAFMKGRKKKSSNKSSLSLKVRVIQVRSVDLFRDFDCNPICLVTTESFNSKRTSKLRHQKMRWDEELRIRLPVKPTSEWVRIIIYDALPVSSATTQDIDGRYSPVEIMEGGSEVPTNTPTGTRSSQSSTVDLESQTRKTLRQRKYLYVGEAKLSLLDLFKGSEGEEFTIPHAWYKIYDRRRHTMGKSDGSYGEVELGFSLTSQKKHISTEQAYVEWKNSLAATLRYQKNLKKAHSSCSSSSKPANGSFSDLEKPDQRYIDEDDEAYDSYVEYSEEDAAGEFNPVDSEYELLLPFPSHESEETEFDSPRVDLTSMVTALDEYDVMGPEELSVSPPMSSLDLSNGTAIREASRFTAEDDVEEDTDTMDEYSEDEDDNTADITISRSGGRLKNFSKRNHDSKFRSRYLSSWANYKLSKKQHAAGVVFMEIKSIKGLPSSRTKVSRRKYDMDPFVIAVFGRRVFKTSWRKHTLNPIFNECAAFEVFRDETHFGFHFNVMDKDAFSYNNKVARCHLSWSDMMEAQRDDKSWASFELPLELVRHKFCSKPPKLLIKMRFIPYAILKKFFWQNAVNMGTTLETFDIAQLSSYLDRIGSFTTEEVCQFFAHFQRLPWTGACITKDELIEYLQTWNQSAGFKNVWKCPKCSRSCKPSRNTMNSKLVVENDLITHFAVCSYERKCKLLKPSYVSSDFASKRWYSKILIKLTYGKYALGTNNANILVQDRDTGIILEEKISAHVKLGMRIIYNGKGKQSKNFRQLLKTLSVRQGRKFDDPSSVKQIESFIKYHSLNMSECQKCEYKTFNEFFYRKLKPGTRIPEGGSGKIFVSPADSRCTVFASIQQSKEIWIKGSSFTLTRLTRGYSPEMFNDKSCSIAVFRLAPQDYHRFHSPCNGVIGKPIYIEGEYYTVNPMAVRSSLDVFCENVRMVIPIDSQEFGTLLCIPIGAMMVGSIMLTCKEGDFVTRGQELGYFKFGGSTIVIVMPSQRILFDPDLSRNTADGIETLVKVGMSVGHTPDIPEYERERIRLENPEQIERVKRKISIKHQDADILAKFSWQYHALENFLTAEYGEPETVLEAGENTHRGFVVESSSSSTLPSSSG